MLFFFLQYHKSSFLTNVLSRSLKTFFECWNCQINYCWTNLQMNNFIQRHDNNAVINIGCWFCFYFITAKLVKPQILNWISEKLSQRDQYICNLIIFFNLSWLFLKILHRLWLIILWKSFQMCSYHKVEALNVYSVLVAL